MLINTVDYYAHLYISTYLSVCLLNFPLLWDKEVLLIMIHKRIISKATFVSYPSSNKLHVFLSHKVLQFYLWFWKLNIDGQFPVTLGWAEVKIIM